MNERPGNQPRLERLKKYNALFLLLGAYIVTVASAVAVNSCRHEEVHPFPTTNIPPISETVVFKP
jgi:hypothetical protein